MAENLDRAFDVLAKIKENKVDTMIEWLHTSGVLKMLNKSKKEAKQLFGGRECRHEVSKPLFKEVLWALAQNDKCVFKHIKQKLMCDDGRVKQSIDAGIRAYNERMDPNWTEAYWPFNTERMRIK